MECRGCRELRTDVSAGLCRPCTVLDRIKSELEALPAAKQGPVADSLLFTVEAFFLTGRTP